jgi:hypothetical protein
MVNKEKSRDRGILTPTDREYLLGEKTYEAETSELHRRAEIRDRVVEAVADFQLLLERLGAEDREKVFDRILGNGVEEPSSRYNIEGARSIKDGLAFLYLGILEYSDPDDGHPLFGELLEAAVEDVEMDRGNTVKDIEFDVQTQMVIPWDELKKTMDTRGVSPRAKRSLDYHLKENRENIDTEEAQEYLHEYYELL